MRINDIDYGRLDYNYCSYLTRWDRRVKQFGLICQECGGLGGETEPVVDFGQGPWVVCGWCDGTGKLDPWRRGLWLRLHKSSHGD